MNQNQIEKTVLQKERKLQQRTSLSSSSIISWRNEIGNNLVANVTFQGKHFLTKRTRLLFCMDYDELFTSTLNIAFASNSCLDVKFSFEHKANELLFLFWHYSNAKLAELIPAAAPFHLTFTFFYVVVMDIWIYSGY